MSTNYSAFLKNVLPECPGVPYSVAFDAVRLAAIEFCKESTVLTKNHANISLVADQTAYALTTPTDLDIQSVAGDIKYGPDGSIIFQRPRTYLSVEIPDWENKTGIKPEFFYVSYGDGATTTWYINVVPKPTEAVTDALAGIVLICSPLNNSTTVPTIIYEKWLEEIAAGAKARLMAMPTKEWSNPELAGYYKGIFMKGVADALRFIQSGGKDTKTNKYRRATGYYY